MLEAGSDTTAATLVGFIQAMVLFPEVQKKAQVVGSLSLTVAFESPFISFGERGMPGGSSHRPVIPAVQDVGATKLRIRWKSEFTKTHLISANAGPNLQNGQQPRYGALKPSGVISCMRAIRLHIGGFRRISIPSEFTRVYTVSYPPWYTTYLF